MYSFIMPAVLVPMMIWFCAMMYVYVAAALAVVPPTYRYSPDVVNSLLSL